MQKILNNTSPQPNLLAERNIKEGSEAHSESVITDRPTSTSKFEKSIDEAMDIIDS